MINGWEFPSHDHHGDIDGSEPTQGGPTSQVGRPTLCFHVGPTNLLEGAEVGGSVGQVGPTKCGLADHLAPYNVPTLQGFAPLAPTQIHCNMPILVAVGAIAIKKFRKMSLRKAWWY